MELDSQNLERFSSYDKAIISKEYAIFINSDSESYHGPGNPVNETVIPYFDEYHAEPPEILSLFF